MLQVATLLDLVLMVGRGMVPDRLPMLPLGGNDITQLGMLLCVAFVFHEAIRLWR
jgi:hypothetical protein|tara:strand:- start:33 stop:197 length:165 start_codon:yes stop_codon:yes gene_type:complete